MQKAIHEMYETLDDNNYVAFIGETHHSALGKNDEFHFLDGNLILIKRRSGRKSIVNLNMIVEVCIRMDVI